MKKHTINLLLLSYLVIAPSVAQKSLHEFKPGAVIKSQEFNDNFNELQTQIQNLHKTLDDALFKQQQIDKELQTINQRLEALVLIANQLNSMEEAISTLQKTLTSLQEANSETLLSSLEQRLNEIETKIFTQEVSPNLPLVNDLNPKMIPIKGGTFIMGSPFLETNRKDNEEQHEVFVEDFYIGQYEVTFAEYDRFAEAMGRKKPDDQGWGRGNRPVINVSWDDAVAYAEWLSSQTGENYRLPTEAQWEYAARGGTKTAYWWGDDIGKNNANCHGCGSQWDNKRTAPVRSFKANDYGLYDTAGNVWEWTCSKYDPGYGDAKRCISKNNTNNESADRVIRGGSWNSDPSGARAAYRNWGGASFSDTYLGFRLARP